MARTPLSDFEIAEAALSAGFTLNGTATAVAVALAESGGRPDVVNTAGNHPASRDRGLWQINDYYHPEVSDAEAFNPVLAAREAYRISNGGTNWHPWATWVSGAHLKFLHRADIAARAVSPSAFTLYRYLRLTSPQMFGVDVAVLQHQLAKLPPVAHAPKVEITGVFSPLTGAVVQQFQHSQKLTADGIVGPLTARALGWSWVLRA